MEPCASCLCTNYLKWRFASHGMLMTYLVISVGDEDSGFGVGLVTAEPTSDLVLTEMGVLIVACTLSSARHMYTSVNQVLLRRD